MIFIKSFYLNGNTEFYEIIGALPEDFFIFLLNYFLVKINCSYHFLKKNFLNSNTQL